MKLQAPAQPPKLNVLLIGNNPIELGSLLTVLHNIKQEIVCTEIAFDFKSAENRLQHFMPDYILIDDNIGKAELTEILSFLQHTRTKAIPIAVIKNSNYLEAASSPSILDFQLKKNITPESLYYTIKNTLKLSRTMNYLLALYTHKVKHSY